MTLFSSTKDVYDYVAFCGNLALVGVGIWGIKVALRSVRAAEKSAIAAKDGAEASLLNAKALIDAERPWLVAEATGYPHIAMRWVNKGRTPAQIIWYNNFPSWSFPELGGKMGTPHYGALYDNNGSQILNIPMLFPEGTMDAGSFDMDSLKAGSPDLWEELKSMKKLFYLYSAIKYKGPFSNSIYETRYCFLVTSNGPAMAGDYGYNDHTESVPARHSSNTTGKGSSDV